MYADQWSLGDKISSGSFGEIFYCWNIYTQEEAAIKMEPITSRVDQLSMEIKILRLLDPSVGFPRVKWSGSSKNNLILIEELLGPNLQQLFTESESLSLKCVLMIADQLISRIQTLHSHKFLHRDLKPENIAIGRGNHSKVLYLIDFGLSKSFKDSANGHITFRHNKSFIGNYRFSSLSSLLGCEQGRKDDLESLGYILIYLLKGSMPWDSGSSRNIPKLIEFRKSLTVDTICSNCPEAIKQYMEYVTNLKFEEKPNYAYLKKIFRDCFIENGFEYDNQFDWINTKAYKTVSEVSSKKKIFKETMNSTIDEYLKTAGKITSPVQPPEKKNENDSCITF